ncbi:MAG TPA: lipid-binding SYLF domain-containing protein [Chitinolyticbacter sp.]|nr:lipid-binding SYLF domain-containing protein [Chitinolyticbacter sp.]
MMHAQSWVTVFLGLSLCGPAALAAGNGKLEQDAKTALNRLYARIPAAKTLGAQAKATLVFPAIKKAGLGFGGQYGEGVLFRGGKAIARYSTAGASWGLQAGVQTYGYAMFFMTDAALAALDNSQGFEVGVGPSVVVMDEGKARNLTTTTIKDDVYAFVFGQKGLMAGAGVQGNKITRLAK